MSEWSQHVHPHGPLTPLEDGMWWVRGTLPRSPMPRNMVVWRHSEGGLMLYSPVALDEPTMAELEALGDVRWIVVPCQYHRSDAGVYKQRYPDAQVVCPRCAADAVAGVVAPDAMAEEVFPGLGIEAVEPQGLKPYELHPRVPLAGGGHAVMITDALMNLGEDPPTGFGGFMVRMMGSVGPLGITRIGRMMMLRDKAAFRAHLQSLADDPDLRMVLLSHGPPVLTDVADRLREAASRV